ncbi:MAG: AAA family ATPase [Myxococcota bacterium]
MLFTVLSARATATPAPNICYLRTDNWNDWREFKTQFDLIVFDGNSTQHEPGSVKIGQFAMPKGARSADVPPQFDRLRDDQFSLGQGENYYETLNRLPPAFRIRILWALRDLAADPALLERASTERVTTESLFRSVPEQVVRSKLGRLARGEAALTPYRFSFSLPVRSPEIAAARLDFAVSPLSKPPTNVHVLIGSNGVGKTRCLDSLTHSVVWGDTANATDRKKGRKEEVRRHAANGTFYSDPHAHSVTSFSRVVSLSFSAFDPFGPLAESKERPFEVPYYYIGLKRHPSVGQSIADTPPKTIDELQDDFVNAARECLVGARRDRWRVALESLLSDPLFADERIVALADEESGSVGAKAGELFAGLSSGHKVVLLTITRLIEAVDEQTLVLLDEPEAHLHPPLLSAFIRSLSQLLANRNGVAIIATHSPVILQETPKSCVWVIRRTGDFVHAERPEVETFGENVGTLTSEVFGLEVTTSGFHRLLQDAADGADTYPDALAYFNGQLGAEARAILRAMIHRKHTPTGER